MNDGCENPDIIDLIAEIQRKRVFDRVTYEECYSTSGHYISLEKGNYIGFIRREEEPVTIDNEGKQTRITLVSIIKKEGKNKRQIMCFDRKPIAGTKQILKNTYASKETYEENHGFKEFWQSICRYFS
jgi:hypothetical protein